MLKEEHGVVVSYRCLHQAFGIRGRTAGHDFDAGHRMEVSLEPLAVLSTQLAAYTTRTAHHGRNREIAPTRVPQHPHVVGDLAEGEEQKAHIHAFNNRPQAGHGSTHSHPCETVLSDWGIENP